MVRLEPCPACQRHVRVDERRCPFCDAQVAAHFAALPARSLPTSRLGRAALFAFGASAVAAVTASSGCSDGQDFEEDDDDQGGRPDGGKADAGWQDGGMRVDASVSDGGLPTLPDSAVAPVYGLPVFDASVRDAEAGTSEPDAGTGHVWEAGIVPLYGLAVPLPDEKVNK